MYPKNITEYTPEDSERIVYQELKNQLPNSWDVFYSVPWTTYKRGRRILSYDGLEAKRGLYLLCMI